MSYCPPCNAALPPKKSTAWDAVGCKNCCGTVFSTSKLDAIAALLRAAPQFPGVWLLLFHVTVTVSYRLCKLLASRLHLIQPDDSEAPAILTNGYQYARFPVLAWTATGAVVGMSLSGAAFAGIGICGMSLSAAAFAVLGYVRLQGWRQWLRDATGEGHRVLEKKIVDQVLSTADNGQPWRILDFGAGTGSTTKHVLLHHRVASVDAIDIKATPPHVKAYDGETIPFPPDSFDLAIAMCEWRRV